MLKNLVSDAIQYYLNVIVQQLNSFIGDLANIMSSSLGFLDLPIVKSGIHYAQYTAISILVVKVAFEAVRTHILYSNGDSEADPGGLVIRTFYSVAVISSIPWITRYMFELGTSFTSDILGLNGQGISADLSFLGVSDTVVSMLDVLCIILIVGIVLLIIVTIQAYIRAAYFAFLSVIGAFIALNLTSQNFSLFKMWFKEVLIVCVSQGIQIFLIKAAFSSFTLISNSLFIVKALSFLGWMWVTYKTPAFLKQFTYSSGVSSASGSLVTNILLRKFAR